MRAIKIIFLAGIVLFFVGTAASAQGNLTDLSETFKIFEDVRSLTQGFDLTSSQFTQAIPENYRLGPGDDILVMAGKFAVDLGHLRVSPQGDVLIPPAGKIILDGLTVQEAELAIYNALDKYHNDLIVEIQILQVRKIEVYLLGQVMLPGIYMTFAAESPIGFLQNASGLVNTPPPGSEIDESDYLSPYLRIMNASASRYVEVHRDEVIIGELDVASILFNGYPEPDILLEDGDVIFVPSIEKPVIVSGGVLKPGKYELGKDEDLTDILLMAGGSTSVQFVTNIIVERDSLTGPKEIKLGLNRNYEPFDKEFSLRPGDLVRVPELVELVYVIGAVFMPNAYEYREGWRTIDYVGQAGGFIAPGDFSTTVLIHDPGTANSQAIRVDLKEMMKGELVNDPAVQRGDVIFVPYQNKPWTGQGITGTLLQAATLVRLLFNN